MTPLTLAIAIVSFLNALVSVVGAIYAFSTIRGSWVGLWMASQILLIVLTLLSPFVTYLSASYLNLDRLEIIVLSQNLLLAALSLFASALFILVVARIEKLKKMNTSAPIKPSEVL